VLDVDMLMNPCLFDGLIVHCNRCTSIKFDPISLTFVFPKMGIECGERLVVRRFQAVRTGVFSLP